MKKIFQKYRLEFFSLLLLSSIYLLTRLPFLTSLPMFTDEAIYIFWGKFVATDYSHWFISTTDGKPPLLIWMMFPFFHILPDSWYLIAGRLPSVLAGWASLMAIFLIAKLLFKTYRTAIISSVLYIVIPFFLFYDRMALFDSLLNSTLLWATYFALRTAQTWKLRDALLWALFLLMAMLSKGTALMFFVLLPFVVGVMTYRKELLKHKKQFVGYTLLVSGIGYSFNLFLRFVLPDLNNAYIAKNSQFQIPLDQVIASPFPQMFSNLHAIFSWIIPYITLPIFVTGFASFALLLLKKPRIGIVLLALCLIPILGLATFGQIIFPRYFVFTASYLVLAVGFFVDYAMSLSKKYQWAIVIFGVILLLPAIRFDYFILKDPEHAPFPVTDVYQFVYDHPSGYGIQEVYDYINQESAKGEPITVVTQGTFGLYPYAFNLEYWTDSNITIMPKFPLDKIDDEILAADENSEVLFIFKEVLQIPENLPIEEVFRADKPGEKYNIIVGKFKK